MSNKKNQNAVAATDKGTAAPSNAMLALFKAAPDASKMKRRNLPQLIKPESIPYGQIGRAHV